MYICNVVVPDALLQSRLMAYKDSSKLAGGYAAAGTKSLAPDMAAQLDKVRHYASRRCSRFGIIRSLCSAV